MKFRYNSRKKKGKSNYVFETTPIDQNLIIMDHYLPSNTNLHQLREVLIKADNIMVDANGLLPATIFEELQSYRQEVHDVIQRNGSALPAYSYFFKTWQKLSELMPNHTYYVPPLYVSSELREILCCAIRELIMRESRQKVGCDINIGHLVLGGVEGAGKTTILRAICFACAVLLKRMLPITHDFTDKHSQPSQILKEAFSVYFPELPSHNNSYSDPIDWFQAVEHDVVLLLDEFQQLFLHPEHPNFLLGIAATNETHKYSRRYGTYGIIGGSTHDMKTLMFRNSIDSTADFWRRYGYPDFNGTLYRFHKVPAIRTVEELTDYIQRRYPNWILTSSEVAQLLYYTGGIGRWVHDCWKVTIHVIEPNENHEYTFLSISRLENCMDYRKVLPEQFVEDQERRQLVVYLSQFGPPTFHPTTSELQSCGGVSKILLFAALSEMGVKSPTTVLEDAQACSVVYVNDIQSIVQFARPVDYIYYHTKLPPSLHRVLLLTAIHLMVHGIEAENDDSLTNVNAGGALEEFVRPCVFQSTCINDEAIFDPTSRLVIGSDGKLCIYSLHDSTTQVIDEQMLLSLHNKHISWSKEHGIDGISLFCTENKGKITVVIDAWQCKGGRYDVEIGGGNGSFATALENYKKKHRLQDVRDKQLTEIVFKAQVGIVMIAKAVLASIPTCDVYPRKLVITTTKQLSSSGKQTLHNWDVCNGIVIENYILEHYQITPRLRKQLRTKCEVQVVCGCGWVIESISTKETELRQLARKLLPINENPVSPMIEKKSDKCTIA